jgi:uncharacterized membrane protein YidH (DUF202 family)
MPIHDHLLRLSCDAQYSNLQGPQSCESHANGDVGAANERTFLAYLRTSLVLSMLGVLIAQLYRLQHSPSPGVIFGYYVLSLPLSILFQCAAILVLGLGCIRFYRQQAAMARGKVHAGGWDLFTLMGSAFMVSASAIQSLDSNDRLSALPL